MRLMIHPRNFTADVEFRGRAEQCIESALGSVQPRLRGVDVYLTDVNGPRGGPDKRCRIVAHLPAGQPVVVSRTGDDPVSAVLAAAARCRHSVRSRLKRRRDRRRRTPVAA